MNFLIRALLGIVALFMIVITIASAVSAYSYYPDLYPVQPTNFYYQDHEGKMPIIIGPYPQYYLAYQNPGLKYAHDDFNNFDTFEGYKDLDVFRPDGSIDILRNENPTEPIWDDVDEDGHKLFGYHVYGMLPDGSIYRKHYMHEHPFEVQQYNYYGYYYTPYLAYRNLPQVTRPCQQKDICQKLNNCC